MLPCALGRVVEDVDPYRQSLLFRVNKEVFRNSLRSSAGGRLPPLQISLHFSRTNIFPNTKVFGGQGTFYKKFLAGFGAVPQTVSSNQKRIFVLRRKSFFGVLMYCSFCMRIARWYFFSKLAFLLKSLSFFYKLFGMMSCMASGRISMVGLVLRWISPSACRVMGASEIIFSFLHFL